MGLKFKLKVFGREPEGKPFFKRVSLGNTHKYYCDNNTGIYYNGIYKKFLKKFLKKY